MTARSVALLAVLFAACEPEPACEEDVRAQVLTERVEVSVGARTLEAELADDAVERDRGWMHRRCDREAILLVPDAPASSLPIWGCGLVDSVDAAFIASDEVVALERIEPCAEPCAGCPTFGDELLIDAVLEVPPGVLDSPILGAPASF